MNRKDTILVAVLINAGVLVVLFTSALKNKNHENLALNAEPIVAMQESKIEPISIMKDEIDLAIEQAKKEQENKQQQAPQVAQELVFDQSQTQDTANELNLSQSQDSQEPSFVDFTVKKGDFLAKIAKRYNVSVEQIMKANNMKNSNLRIGQVLKIPQALAKSPVPNKVKSLEITSDVASGIKTYVIKPGDNPWTIAKKHNMKVDELLKMNHLTAEKAKQLKVGDKLQVKS